MNIKAQISVSNKLTLEQKSNSNKNLNEIGQDKFDYQTCVQKIL